MSLRSPSLRLFAAVSVIGLAPFLAQAYNNPIAGVWAGVDNIPVFLLKVIEMILPIAVALCVLFIIYAGFLFATAGGNEMQATKAKRVILWTLVGVALILGALVLEKAICETILSLGGTGVCL
ncbi:MAG TPA: hypothetical protein VLB83_05610 [Candidatus Paceibacterota bacterium]|nr:hypothetical protein [Candidatus Paceibacterota bacterium]